MSSALVLDPAAKYGGSLLGGMGPAHESQLPVVAGPSTAEQVVVNPIHPDSPLLWFGVIAAAAVGLMYASTTVRVGPVKVSASAGKS